MDFMKPKIKKFNFAWWQCVGSGFSAYGMSAILAFDAWERSLKISQNRFRRDIL